MAEPQRIERDAETLTSQPRRRRETEVALTLRPFEIALVEGPSPDKP